MLISIKTKTTNIKQQYTTNYQYTWQNAHLEQKYHNMPYTCSFYEQLFHFIKNTNTFTERLRLNRITSNDENRKKKIHKLENKLYPTQNIHVLKQCTCILHISWNKKTNCSLIAHMIFIASYFCIFLKLAMLIGD